MMHNITNITEDQARKLKYCPCCEAEKKEGLVTCWKCWQESYKFFNGSFQEWLIDIRK
jgi:hypothetical protein